MKQERRVRTAGRIAAWCLFTAGFSTTSGLCKAMAAQGQAVSPSSTPVAPTGVDVSAVRPEALRFWIDVYTKYSKDEGLIHDARHLSVIYAHLPRGESATARRDEIRRLLLSLHAKQAQPETWTPEERKIADLFQGIDEANKFLHAAHRKRLRFQQGHRESFLAGWIAAGKYLTRMEEIFRREGVPVEFTRLPFVESSFNLKAYSKVGASGIFQFMPSTGRRFLTINDAVDERNDPIRAAEAAARLLRQNYESLGSWPLAVTAYNHGRLGVMNAVRKVGSQDLKEILLDYRTRGFGFASGNFYVELLASIQVERDAEKYFGKVERARPEEAFEFTVPHYWGFKPFMKAFKFDARRVRELNPALTTEVFSGVYRIPAGYRLRLPNAAGRGREESLKAFELAYARVPAALKHSEQPKRFYAKGSQD